MRRRIATRTTDTYFEQCDQPTAFVVKGREIVAASKRLFRRSNRKRIWGKQHYCPRIKYPSKYLGHINDDIQDRLKPQLIKAILQFRFD